MTPKPWNPMKWYSTKSNAARAARKACKKALNAPEYEAHEAVDFHLIENPDPLAPHGYRYGNRWRYELLDVVRETLEKQAKNGQLPES